MPFEADAYDIFGFGAAGAGSVAVAVVAGGVETGFDAVSLGLAGDAGAPRTTSAAERTPRTTSAALGLPPRTMSAAVIFGAGDDDAVVVVVGFVSTGFVSLVGVAGVAAGAGDDGTGLLSCDKPASRSNAALSNDLSAEKSVLFTAVFTASLSVDNSNHPLTACVTVRKPELSAIFNDFTNVGNSNTFSFNNTLANVAANFGAYGLSMAISSKYSNDNVKPFSTPSLVNILSSAKRL
mmetsp:Transcript_5621/g.9511  ORF Transcript_5621/g.9511 Transcript_5621/m.9511 type:complete len:237 (+) Transcript_5621:879-1589(+)